MIQKLNWDSSFFGYSVGIVNMDSNPDWKMFYNELDKFQSEYQLIYVITPENLFIPNKYLKHFNGKLINQRILYYKEVQYRNHTFPDHILEYKSTKPSNDLIELAILSGQHSRFNIDSLFSKEEFKGLYKTWITRSVAKEIADATFVSQRQSQTTGMATCKVILDTCHIGLVAVDEKEKGQGTGRYLINKIEEYSWENGINSIIVPTQSNNNSACIFYQKIGFSQKKISNYYHFWSK